MGNKAKYTHTSTLLRGNESPLLKLFFEYSQLKNLYRQGWLQRRVKKRDTESCGDHSFGVVLLGYMAASEYRPDLNPLKVAELGIIHELGEVYGGDITPDDGVTPEEKFENELSSVRQVFSAFQDPQKYIALWLEFERGESEEAKFVKQIDKLEAALQANLYERLGYGGLEEFYPYALQKLQDPLLKSLLEEIATSSSK